MKKTLIIISVVLVILIVCFMGFNFLRVGNNIGKISKCDIDKGTMYIIDSNSYDAGSSIILNGKNIFCNWAWGVPLEDCQNLPKTNSCKTIYASPKNIYGESTKITIEGLFMLF